VHSAGQTEIPIFRNKGGTRVRTGYSPDPDHMEVYHGGHGGTEFTESGAAKEFQPLETREASDSESATRRKFNEDG